MSNCAAATSVGDTHLKTFSGMLYDFQASGDFTLARIGTDFDLVMPPPAPLPPPSLAWYSPLDGNADATVGGSDEEGSV